VLVGFLLLCAVATVVGAVLLFPRGDDHQPRGQYAQPGVTFPSATLQQVKPDCGKGASQDCGILVVKLDEGPDRGTTVQVQVSAADARSGLGRGDRVELARIPANGDVPASYNFFGVERHPPLLVLTLLFVLVVVAVARWRGALALVGLVFAGVVVIQFMLPALLRDKPGTAVALVGCTAIMYVVLYLAHGVSLRTSTALAGTLAGIGATALIGHFAIGGTHLSGVGDETAALLGARVHLDFQGLLMAAIILASLGVLNDVTITQASAVWELRSAAPELGRGELFTRGMRIGRDHIASTIYTIVFAYAGTSLALLLSVEFYDRPLLSLLNAEAVAEEVVRTLAGGIGLVLAVPLTTAIAVAVTGSARPRNDE
jgi:uncharacterized membrane protein